jgi:hypothetical protein
MPIHGLTENHERGLLAGVQYAAKLKDMTAIRAALRDVSAALERTSREFLSFSERRQAIVSEILELASRSLADSLRQGRAAGEVVGVDLARPAHDEAERVAQDLENLASQMRNALADAASATSMVGPPETVGVRREVPVLALPPIQLPAKAPPWTHLSASLLRRWTADRLREEWGPALERAVAAYLDVLKRWASDNLAQLREEFESHSRPLLAQLSSDSGLASRTDAARLESDVEWLRRPRGTGTSRERLASRVMPSQE